MIGATYVDLGSWVSSHSKFPPPQLFWENAGIVGQAELASSRKGVLDFRREGDKNNNNSWFFFCRN